jgi:hypothetical protein
VLQVTTRRSRKRYRKRELEVARPIEVEVMAVHKAPERPMVVAIKPACRAATTYSRRHIDLQRVAGALCPAYVNAPARQTTSPHCAS